MKKYYHLSIITLSVIFVTGISLALAQSWEAPEGPPPGGGGAHAPINISTISQSKFGILWAAGLLAMGDVRPVNFMVSDPDTFPTTNTNTRILTISPLDDPSMPGEFRWREAGSWASGISILPFSNYERVQGPVGNPSIAQCSPSKKVVGGGCEPAGGGGPTYILYEWSYPDSDTSFYCYNADGPNVQAYAICAEGL